MYKIPYHIIKQALMAVPRLEKVDWYLEQERVNGELLKDSCAFVRFSPTTLRNLSRGVQEGQLEFTIIALNKTLKNGGNRVTELALPDHLTLLDDVYLAIVAIGRSMLSDIAHFAALKDTEQDVLILNSIVRNGVTPFHNQGGYVRSELTFSCYFRDCTASKSFQQASVGFSIEEIILDTSV
jgi:hypothetical protein